jgi:hypothetical protein
MSFETNVPQVISYEYDFAVDGGAISSIALRPSVVNKLKAGLVITDIYLHVETELASVSGSAIVGTASNDDAFFKDLVALAAGSYSAKNNVIGGDAMVSTVTADSGMATVVALAKELVAAGAAPILKIGTGALTAGKFKIDFHCYQP